MASRPTRAAGAGPAPGPVARPPRTDLALLVVAVGAASTSGPLIAAAAAPGLAIALWRNVFAVGAMLPFTLARAGRELARMRRGEWALALAAGSLLAAHFAAWVPSVRLSSVAAATALVTTQPVWTALIARFRGSRVPPAAWVGIAVAVAGAATVTGADIAVSGRALLGDALALAGAVLAAGYVTVGGEARRSVSTLAYTSICYSTAAGWLLFVCLASGTALAGYPGTAWLEIAALTVGAQLLGHSLVNRVLRTTSATVAALALLFESPVAALIAALWLHQRPPALTFAGLAVLLAGLGLVVRAGAGMPALPAE